MNSVFVPIWQSCIVFPYSCMFSHLYKWLYTIEWCEDLFVEIIETFPSRTSLKFIIIIYIIIIHFSSILLKYFINGPYPPQGTYKTFLWEDLKSNNCRKARLQFQVGSGYFYT